LSIFGHRVLKFSGQRRSELGLASEIDTGDRFECCLELCDDLVARGSELASESLDRQRNICLSLRTRRDLGSLKQQTAGHARLSGACPAVSFVHQQAQEQFRLDTPSRVERSAAGATEMPGSFGKRRAETFLGGSLATPVDCP
jgi:hypothetical protein